MLIQKLRLQRGWSQEQLAELSGLSVRTIQRIERGQTASVESLKSLGAVFEIDFSTLQEPEMYNAAGQGISADEALALAHVRKLRGFYIHFAQYCITIAFLVIVNLLTSSRYHYHYFWVLWVALGWGLGILFHGLRVFD
ncbi:MAG: helix-turn-helix domain-containing protein, partial [Proteobacteria bacterium]|nr:helix-turn-helix domain-containing protein [Pseudomonadota bacterium]